MRPGEVDGTSLETQLNTALNHLLERFWVAGEERREQHPQGPDLAEDRQ